MNPYEASPEKIPATDRYVLEPLYGRYSPRPDDFVPNKCHINSTSPESLKYWASVLERCDVFIRIYENIDDEGRDVFALGSVIVKSTHLKEKLEGKKVHRDYSLADMNEVRATALARSVLTNIKIPEIYFAGKIEGRDVLIQERIPGVGLNVAWQYLSQAQKESFKLQARNLLHRLQEIQPPSTQTHRSYLVPDPDPVEHRGIQTLEMDIIFGADNRNPDLSFMHNDLSPSNIIVDNDRIVGLVDWEMAGCFGWDTAGIVHVQIRSPKKENFAALELSQELLDDIMFWNNLYD
ncbi:MAG: hypothetical protein M1820_001802 [Bogoriella megaspora]|nr:MAG: hypothetical protein M1820_001802 [Bogoriella megaspora]